MASSTDTTWVGKKPLRRIGGMSDALSIAADLGFSVSPPPTQVSLPLCVPNFLFCAHFWLFCLPHLPFASVLFPAGVLQFEISI